MTLSAARPGARSRPAVPAAAPATARWEAEIGPIPVRYGAGRLAELGEAARELGGTRVLLVTDEGVERAGHAANAERALADAGLEVVAFDGVDPNPTEAHVEAGVAAATGRDIDLIVAVGGGSVLDCAKAVNMVLTNGGTIEDFWGMGKAQRPLLPSIGVPTTAGTGSDAQSYALISRGESGRKMACGDRGARFRTVLLDPELLASVPRVVAAAAGLDALSHAVESQVSLAANPISRLYSREAWRLVEGSLEAALGETPAPAASGQLLVGAHLAGTAIEASMLGAAHAAANPLTARFGVVHGEAVALLLPHVVRWNASEVEARYAELAPDGGSAAVAARIEALRRAAGLAERLSDRGVGRGDVRPLAELATDEWTGRFNPRPLERSDFEEIYDAAL